MTNEKYYFAELNYGLVSYGGSRDCREGSSANILSVGAFPLTLGNQSRGLTIASVPMIQCLTTVAVLYQLCLPKISTLHTRLLLCKGGQEEDMQEKEKEVGGVWLDERT